MKYRIYAIAATTFVMSAVITSCLSFNSARNPANEYSGQVEAILKDSFSQDGYDHSQLRDFGNGKISDTQIVRELAGRAIWFKSAPNERHHTYLFPQKIGVGIDWNQAFATNVRSSRFQTWGLINDPDCCVPGVSCEQKNMRYNGKPVTLADTYGWEYCAGDEALLNSLRSDIRGAYRDPACDDPVIKAADSLDGKIRENRCELAFGTSAGAVGYRKFPNPRFNEKRWQKIGGWKGYSEQMIREGINNSIQPPFRIAKACASCHAAYDPLNPPKDLNNPTWANIKGETGNQYLNVSKLMANGMKEDSLETQLFTHTRPGVVDTSAVPHDFINNPGTINAIINLPSRPLFDETVSRWVEVSSCNESDVKNCQRVTYKNESGMPQGTKYWAWQKVKMKVPHILKGGEDNVGYDLAVQRVYVNIGMCAEQCWLNHLTNLKELDYTSRGYGQSPFDIGQCRKDCASFRANEDRVGDIFSYLASRRPTDLKDALKSVAAKDGQPVVPQSPNKALVDAKFKNFLETRYGEGAIEKGQKIFANNCAQCHSSQNANSRENLTPNENNFEGVNFFAQKTLDSGEIIRADWMGNDKSTPVDEVGTYKCRALHTNHKRGQVWQDLSSDTYKNLPSAQNDKFGKEILGGPGYYRNISLLNVWAHAPFMHNNAIGPEICGNVDISRQVVKTSIEGLQTDGTKKFICDMKYNPSVMGRLELYDKSMDELLTPSESRRKKVTRVDVPIKFPLGVKDMYLEFPAGIPLNLIANFDIKAFLYDFTYAQSTLENSGEEAYRKYWSQKFADNPQGAKEVGDAVKVVIDSFKTPSGVFSIFQQVKKQDVPSLKVISKYYRTCEVEGDFENTGHNFKTDLSQADKQALKAFMATL